MVYGPLGRATVTAGVYPAVGGGARSGPCCLRELLRGQALQSVPRSQALQSVPRR
jgi:hypothetical protein